MLCDIYTIPTTTHLILSCALSQRSVEYYFADKGRLGGMLTGFLYGCHGLAESQVIGVDGLCSASSKGKNQSTVQNLRDTPPPLLWRMIR